LKRLRGVSVLDRYIASCFIRYFLLCTFAVIGLFLAVSIFQQIKDLLKRPLLEMLSVIGLFSLFNIPVLFSRLLPAAVLIGASYCIVQMSRANELTALKAAGVSIYRILQPVFVCASILAVLSIMNQEWILPRIGPEIEAFYRDQGFKKNELKSLFGLVRQERMIYRVAVFRLGGRKERKTESRRTEPPEMSNGMFWWRNEDGQVVRSLRVQHAVYIGGGQWRCFNATETKLIGQEKQEVQEYDEYILKTALTPERLAVQAMDRAFMSVGQLIERLREDPNNLDFRILLHSRFSYPLSGIVLLLIGLPPIIGMERLSRNRFLGAGASISIAAIFWVVTFVSEWLGKQGLLPMPFLAAWLPIILFASIGIYLFDGIPT